MCTLIAPTMPTYSPIKCKSPKTQHNRSVYFKYKGLISKPDLFPVDVPALIQEYGQQLNPQSSTDNMNQHSIYITMAETEATTFTCFNMRVNEIEGKKNNHPYMHACGYIIIIKGKFLSRDILNYNWQRR